MTIILFLLIIAVILFGLATFGVTTRFNLIAGGLFAWALSVLLAGMKLHQ